jgi:hypothetical protein
MPAGYLKLPIFEGRQAWARQKLARKFSCSGVFLYAILD